MPSLLLILIGAGLLIGSWLSAKKTKLFVKDGVKTKATVIEVISEKTNSTDEDGYSTTSVSYYPLLRFTAMDGKEYQFKAGVGVSNKRKWRVHQVVDIIYHRTQPSKAKINSFLQLWFLPLMLGIFGSLFLIIGAVVLVS